MFLINDHRQGRRMAPSNLHVDPVAYGFYMMDWDSFANYYDFPSLPHGTLAIIWSSAFFWMPSPIGVWNIPGAIAITLILYLPRSLARGRTIPRTAPFVVAYITCPLCPSYPATLLTSMITPLSPSTSGCSDINLAANLATLNVPTTLIFKSLYISSVEATPLLQMMLPIVATPAQ